MKRTLLFLFYIYYNKKFFKSQKIFCYMVGVEGFEPSNTGFQDLQNDCCLGLFLDRAVTRLCQFATRPYIGTIVVPTSFVTPDGRRPKAPWSRWRDSNPQPLVPKTSRQAIDIHHDKLVTKCFMAELGFEPRLASYHDAILTIKLLCLLVAVGDY